MRPPRALSLGRLGGDHRSVYSAADAYPAGGFDWAVAVDTLWPVPGIDPLVGVAELRRVVRAGGRVALLFWSGQMLLPGYPVLEARLGLAHALRNPYLAGVSPRLHFHRALGWLREAGLVETATGACVARSRGPFQGERLQALRSCLDMLYGEAAEALEPADRQQYRALADAEAPGGLGGSPDDLVEIAYCWFLGRVPVGR